MSSTASLKRGRPPTANARHWCPYVNWAHCLCPKRPFSDLDNRVILEALEEGLTLEAAAQLFKRDLEHLTRHVAWLESSLERNSAS